MKIIVIGGTAAGLSAASKAKRNRPDVEITVYEKSGYVSYGSCGLPYFVGDLIREEEELFSLTPDVLNNKRDIATHIAHEVTAVDPQQKQVTVKNLQTGEVFTDSYDKLVLATGASSIVPPFCQNSPQGVHTLRNVEDGIRLKDSVAGGQKTAVIIGAGLIGLELAEQLQERGLSVTLVEAAPMLLPQLNQGYSQMVADTLATHGVTLLLGSMAAGLHQAQGQVTAVELADGSVLPADLVVLSIGVRPNTALLSHVEKLKNGAIAINQYMETSDPDIYACGDCASSPHRLTGDTVYIPMGTTANKQGKACGDNLTGLRTPFGGVLGSAVTKVFETYVCYTGLNLAQALERGYAAVSTGITKRDRASYYPGGQDTHLTVIFDQKTGQILGAQGVGGESVAGRMNVMICAITANMTISTLNDLDLLYTPAVAPVYDPILVMSGQAIKKLS